MKQPTFQIKTEQSTDDYAQLVFEPLEPGFGTTLGNALRRVLLGHIPGAAVTSVQIAGVNHQFTTLEGLREDIVDLILNIKQLRLSYQGTEPTKATLKANGPGDVTAKQIELPSGVELANQDLVIAHLADKKSKLEVTFNIESGVGYSPAEERQINTLGLIPVDAVFSPVTRVNFTVSDTRVGRFTNYDKLTLEVWTDGTVSPDSAVKQSAGLLSSFFKQIVDPVDQEVEEGVSKSQSEPEVYKITVEELELPTRIANALRKAGLGTVKALVKAKKADITKIKNLGSKSIDVVELALKAKGVEMGQK